MKNDNTFYITTPIYYVNDVPHIGHAYTTIAADVLARFHRQLGKDVYFLTGTDEHGQKIQQAAEKNNETPQQLADRVCRRFSDLWKILNISNSDFIRTTQERHRRVVQRFFEEVQKNGDIFLGEYEGWYHTSSESFITAQQIKEMGLTEDSPEIKKLKEPSYFFKLSAFQEKLLKLYNERSFIEPETRCNEVKSFVSGGLNDLSLSRTTFDWGIPVPGDEKHVIYVWFDALLNYISALNYGDSDDEKFQTFWPADVQLVGKDILRFHTVYWPAFLMSGGIEPPKKVFAHGWWTIEGQKMSKSLGNVVDPVEMANTYGTDPFRYFLLAEVPFGQDGNFSISALEGRINSDLANDLGNLFSRTIGMHLKYFGDVSPGADQPFKPEKEEKTLLDKVKSLYGNLDHLTSLYDQLKFQVILNEIFGVLGEANRYIDSVQPWALAKDMDKNKMKLQSVMYHLFEVLRLTTLALYPFMPGKAEEMWKTLGLSSNLSELCLQEHLKWGMFPSEAVPVKTKAIFPRIENK